MRVQGGVPLHVVYAPIVGLSVDQYWEFACNLEIALKVLKAEEGVVVVMGDLNVDLVRV